MNFFMFFKALFLIAKFTVANVKMPERSPSYEELLANSFRADGLIHWKWELNPFCESQISPNSLRKAFTLKVTVMLEKADCTKVHMEGVYCEYEREQKEKDILSRGANLYVNGLNDDTFRLEKPEKSMCNDPHTWILREQIFNCVCIPIVGKFLPYIADSVSVSRSEMILLEYYKANGRIRWLWNPKLICRLNIPPGWRSGDAFISKRDITLRWANCASIYMDVLHCEYRASKSVSDSVALSTWHFYTCGPNGELFYGGMPDRSYCSIDVTGTILSEIVDAEHSVLGEAKLGGVANIFKILRDRRRGAILHERKWPQPLAEENSASTSAEISL